VTVPFY